MEDKKRVLYDALSQDFELGSFEDFSNNINDETKRRNLYDAASKDYDLGDFDSFNEKLGYGAVQQQEAMPENGAVGQPAAERPAQPAAKKAPVLTDEQKRLASEYNKRNTIVEAPEALGPEKPEVPGTLASKYQISVPSFTETYNKQTTASTASLFGNEDKYASDMAEAQKLREKSEELYASTSGLKGEERKAAKKQAKEYAEKADTMLKAAERNPVHGQVIESANKTIDEQYKAISDSLDATRQERTRLEKEDYEGWQQSGLGKDARNYTSAKHFLEDAKATLAKTNKFESDKKYAGFGDTMLDALKNERFWVSEIDRLDNKALRGIYEKIYNETKSLKPEELEKVELDTILSPSEKAMLEAYNEKIGAEAMRAYDMSAGVEAGEMAAQSAKMIAEMAITAPLAALGSTKTLVPLFNKYVLKNVQELTPILEKGIGKVGGKIVGKSAEALTKGVRQVGAAVTGGAVGVLGTPTLYKDYSQNLLNINDKGQLQSRVDAFFEAYKNNLKEYATERGIGELPGQALGFIARETGLSAAIAGGLNAGLVKTGKRVISAMRNGKLATAGAFNNVGEYFEEYVGALVDEHIFKNKGSMAKFWDGDNLEKMVVGFAPMMLVGLAGSGVSTAALNVADRNFHSKLGRARTALANAGIFFDDTQWNNFAASYNKQLFDATSAEDIDAMSQNLMDSVKGITEAAESYANENGIALKDQEKSDILKSLNAAYQAGMEGIAAKAALDAENEVDIEDKEKEISDSIGGKVFKYSGGREGIEVITANHNGNKVFVLGDLNGRGEYPCIENGAQRFISADSLTDVEEFAPGAYAQSLVDNDKKNAEAERMLNETNEKVAQVTSQFEIGSQIQIDGETVTVVDANPREINIERADGTIDAIPIEQAAAMVGVDMNVNTDADNEAIKEAQMQQSINDRQGILDVLTSAIAKGITVAETGEQVKAVIEESINPETMTASIVLAHLDENGIEDGRRIVENYPIGDIVGNESAELLSQGGESQAENVSASEEGSITAGTTSPAEAPISEETEATAESAKEEEPNWDTLISENPAEYLRKYGSKRSPEEAIADIEAIRDDAIKQAKKAKSINEREALRDKADALTKMVDDYVAEINAATEAEEKKAEEAERTRKIDKIAATAVDFFDANDEYSFEDFKYYIGLAKKRLEELKDGANDEQLAKIDQKLLLLSDVDDLTDYVLESYPDEPIEGDTKVSKKELEPQNPLEVAAWLLSHGEIKLNRESLAKALGVDKNSKEIAAFSGRRGIVLKSGISVEAAGDEVELACREFGVRLNEEGGNAGTNVLIDLLSSSKNVYDIYNYIRSNRKGEKIRANEDVAGEFANVIKEKFGISLDEYNEQVSDVRKYFILNLEGDTRKIAKFETKEIKDESVSEENAGVPEDGRQSEESRDSESDGLQQGEQSVDEGSDSGEQEQTAGTGVNSTDESVAVGDEGRERDGEVAEEAAPTSVTKTIPIEKIDAIFQDVQNRKYVNVGSKELREALYEATSVYGPYEQKYVDKLIDAAEKEKGNALADAILAEVVEKEVATESVSAKEEPATPTESKEEQAPTQAEEEVEDKELTEDEIRNSGARKELIAPAIAYINGNKSSINEIAYETIKEYVRNKSNNLESGSGNANGTQLGAAYAESVGGESGRDGGEVQPMGNEANEGVGSSEDNQGEPGIPSGEQGDRGSDSEEPELFGNPTKRKDSGRSGNTGRKRGDDNGQVGKTGGSDNSGNDSSRGSSNRPKRVVKQTRQELKSERDDILKALNDAFAEGFKKGQGELSLDLTFGSKNYNWGVILPLSLDLAHNLVKTSVRTLEDFLEKMESWLGEKLRQAGMSAEQVVAYFKELWDSVYESNGETRKISEWASKYGLERDDADMATNIAEKKKNQEKADKETEIIIGDEENIAETLPFLLGEQQRDVYLAEKQFFDNSHNDRAHGFGKGYLFTNATGTGKTFTGLGIIKRFQRIGKKRILIVTPTQTKVSDWVGDAKSMNIEATALKDTKDKGAGLVVTTFANFYQNSALLEDEFDLVVYDEAHRLVTNQSGADTAAERKHYMVTNRDYKQSLARLQGADKLWQHHIELMEELVELDNKRASEIVEARNKQNDPSSDYINKLSELNTIRYELRTKYGSGVMNNPDWQEITPEDRKKLEKARALREELGSYNPEAIEEKYRIRERELRTEISETEDKMRSKLPELEEKARAAAGKTKVVFLSASPFATHDNVRYAEGYIFDYGEDSETARLRRAYEDESGNDIFMYALSLSSKRRKKFENYNRIFSQDTAEETWKRAASSKWKTSTFPEMYSGRNASKNAAVDYDKLGVKERGFADHMMRDLNTMSGRPVNISHDYSRKAPIVQIMQGSMFNAAIDAISKGGALGILSSYGSQIRNNDVKDYVGKGGFHRTVLDYNWSEFLFQAMKASVIADRIKEHIKLGRKVVLFHSRINPPAAKGGSRGKQIPPMGPPFATALKIAREDAERIRNMDSEMLAQQIEDACSQFEMQYGRILAWEQTLDYENPVRQVIKNMATEEDIAKYEAAHKKWEEKGKTGAEPELRASGVLLFNGEDDLNDKPEVPNKFNDDNQNYNVIVVQQQSGKEGISLHDKTGKHQRVLINIALPYNPIDFIQIEGRIYRLGNASNAIFEYPVLGLALEYGHFANKINNRAGTTENLSLGSQARDLTNSIKDMVLHAGEVSLEGEGFGGKEQDSRDLRNANPDFEKAISDYREAKASDVGKDVPGFFSTPEPLGYKMVEWAKLSEGEDVLEPGAGTGSIARYVNNENAVDALETVQSLRARLGLILGGNKRVKDDNFLAFSHMNKYDSVLMCPPTDNGVDTAMMHLKKGFVHLAEGGRLVAAIPTKLANRPDFDSWIKGTSSDYTEEEKNSKTNAYNPALVARIDLPFVAYEDAKEPMTVVIMDKVTRREMRKNVPSMVEHNLSGIRTIDEFFDTIKGMEAPARTIDTSAIAKKRLAQIAAQINDTEGDILFGFKDNKPAQFNKDMDRLEIRVSYDAYYNMIYKPVKVFAGAFYNANYNKERNSAHALFVIPLLGEGAKADIGFANSYVRLANYNLLGDEEFSNTVMRTKSPQQLEQARRLYSLIERAMQAVSGLTDGQLRRLAAGLSENVRPGEVDQTLDLVGFKDKFEVNVGTNERKSELFKRVYKFMTEAGTAIEVQPRGTTDGSAGKFDFEGNTMIINSDEWNREPAERNAEVSLHESLHMASLWALEAYDAVENKNYGSISKYVNAKKVLADTELKNACEVIYKVFDQLSKGPESRIFDGEYAMSGKQNEQFRHPRAAEAIAEFANDKFVEKLKKYKIYTYDVGGDKFYSSTKEDGLELENESTAFELMNGALDVILKKFNMNDYSLMRGINPASVSRETTVESILDELDTVRYRSDNGRTYSGEETGKDEIRSAVTSVGKTLGVDIACADNFSGKEARKKAKIEFKKDGTMKITINLQNTEDVADGIASVMHEAVGHYGLRKLFGQEEFDAQMQNIYDSAKKDVQARIDRVAKDGGFNTIEATEEYLSILAEEGFETAEEKSFFQKAIDAIKSLINRLINGAGNMLTDEDMRAILWASRRNLEDSSDPFVVAENEAMRKELRALAEASHKKGKGGGKGGNGGNLGGIDPYYAENRGNRIFISNAENAVRGLNMNKASGEQWLKAIQGRGGLKAAEDKWLGLSDFLAGKKSVTKDELLQFIAENQIQIEETKYSELDIEDEVHGLDKLTEEYRRFMKEAPEDEEPSDYAYSQMEDKYGDEIWNVFKANYKDEIEVRWDAFDQYEDISQVLPKYGVTLAVGSPINTTRLGYTTDNLSNKREIALTVPTIEPWNQSDDIHFGDAGEGRAVAWIRFGETTVNRSLTDEEKSAMMDKIGDVDTWRKLDGSNFVNKHDLYIPNDVAHTSTSIADYGEKGFVLTVRDKSIGLFPTREEAAKEYARIREEEIGRKSTYDKVLFIDEIQSKRHQDGREKGYSKYSQLGYTEEEARDELFDFQDRMRDKYGFIRWSSGRDLLTAEELEEADRLEARWNKAGESRLGVPAAPFEKNWHELAMKRMLRLAAEEGYDKVAWTTGDTQAERYNIGGVVDNIRKEEDFSADEQRFAIRLGSRGTQYITTDNDGNVTHSIVSEFAGKNISEIFGKDVAKKMLAAKEREVISHDDLRIGGEGMKGFYDKILVDFMNKYGKKWGVEVKDEEITNIDQMAHVIDVTPEMRESVMIGQTMFRGAESRDRKAGESARDFYSRCINAFLSAYKAQTEITIKDSPIDGNKDGVYEKSTNTISIFANPNVYSFDAIEEVLFHENFHAYMENSGNIYDFEFFDSLWSFLKSTVDDEDFIAERKQELIDLGYNDNEIQDELSVYAISSTMREGNTFVFENARPLVKDILFDYFNSIGYDRETEDKRRRSTAVNNARNEETLLRESGQGEEQGFEERDREYLEAINSGNLVRAQEMVNEDAEMYLEDFNALQDDANEVGFKYHRGPAPTKIRTMYAVFNVSADGFRAAYAGNKNATPVGVWLDAQNLKSYESRTRKLDDGTPVTYIPGDTGARIEDTGIDSGSLGAEAIGKKWLFERGGKHGTDVPNFSQMNLTRNENGEKVTNKTKDGALPHNKLVFEIECGMSEDGDLTEYVAEHGRMMKGKNQGLKNIGPNQFYFFKTNPNAVGNWGIAGTFRIKRLVPYEEIVEVSEKAGIPVQKWVGGYHPEDSGLTVEQVNNMYREGLKKKLLDPVTYDDFGNVIPLSERFNPDIEDVRYRDDSIRIRDYHKPFTPLEGDREAKKALAQSFAETQLDNVALDYYSTEIARPERIFEEQNSNMYESVKVLYDAIVKETKKPVKDFEDIMQAITSIPRRTEYAKAKYSDTYIAPLKAIVSKLSGLTSAEERVFGRRAGDEKMRRYEDLVKYVELKHGIERNKDMATKTAWAEYTDAFNEKTAKLRAEVTSLDKKIEKIHNEAAAASRALTEDEKKKIATYKSDIADCETKMAQLSSDYEDRRRVLYPKDYYRRVHDREVARINADPLLTAAEKAHDISIVDAVYEDMIRDIDENPDKYEQIKEGDPKYAHLRGIDGKEGNIGRDFAAVMSWFSEYDIPDAEIEHLKNSLTPARFSAEMRKARRQMDGADTLVGAETLAEQYIKEYETKAGAEDIATLWGAINSASNAVIDHQVAHHRLSKAMGESVKSRFKYYVPLRGFSDEQANEVFDYGERDLSSDFTPPLLAMHGRQSRPAEPFSQLAAMMDSGIHEDIKNDRNRYLYKFLVNRPDNSLAYITDAWYTLDETTGEWNAAFPTVDNTETLYGQMQSKKEFEDNMLALAAEGKAVKGRRNLNLGLVNIGAKESDAHVIRVWNLGEEKLIVVNADPRAARALNGELNADSSERMDALRKWLRLLSAANTSWNPAFWFANGAKDWMTAGMNIGINESVGYKAKYDINYAKVIGTMIPTIWREGEFKDNPKWSDRHNRIAKKNAELYSLYLQYGGPTGYSTISSADIYESEIQKLIKRGASAEEIEDYKEKAGALRSVLKLGEIIEQLPRFATFITSYEMGRPIERCISDAKKVTLDFNEKGAYTGISKADVAKLRHVRRSKDGETSVRELNALERTFWRFMLNFPQFARVFYMFYNPAVLGVKRHIENFAKSPYKTSATWAAMIGAGAIRYILGAIFDTGDGDDDDKKKAYKSIHPGTRRNNIVVGTGGPINVLWPISQEYAPLYAVGDIIGQAILKDYGPNDNLVRDAAKALGEITPINPTNIGDALPEQAKSLYEAYVTNKTWAGYNISNSYDWNKRAPEYLKATDYTWEWLVDVSRWANSLPFMGQEGGDYSKPGKINFNPARVQHIIEGQLGGMITSGERIATEATLAVRKLLGLADENEHMKLRNTMVLRRFLMNTEEYADAYVNDRYAQFLEISNRVERNLGDYKRYDDGDRIDALKGTKDYEYYMLYKNYFEKDIDRAKKASKSENWQESKEGQAVLAYLKSEYVKACMEIFDGERSKD